MTKFSSLFPGSEFYNKVLFFNTEVPKYMMLNAKAKARVTMSVSILYFPTEFDRSNLYFIHFYLSAEKEKCGVIEL